MYTLEELASNEQIKAEYRKSLLLNILKKFVGRMRNSVDFNKRVITLYKESTDKLVTTRIVVKKNLNYELSDDDAKLMCKWIIAFLNKSDSRKPIPIGLKERLIKEQNGVCMVCGEPLGKDMAKIHIDHIIPWVLVGDELDDNYQCLCETCNESKSSHTDFIFKKLINLD